MATKRTRSLYFGAFGGETTSFGTKQPTIWSPIVGTQTTVSSGHPWHRLSNPRKRTKNGVTVTEDIGGDFYTAKDFYTALNTPKVFVGSLQGPNRYTTRGISIPTAPNFSGARLLAKESSNGELDAFGTDAIAQVYPTKPASDLAVSAAEILREGIPKMIGSSLLKSKLKDIRKVGDEYLNIEFGWKPLISAVEELVEATQESEKILAQLHRDSGRNVRRRFNAPLERTESESILTPGYPVGQIFSTQLVGAPYKITRQIVKERKRSFAGCFTYHLELGTGEFETWVRLSQEMKKLYGIRINPEVLWNLAPWSWAADWFANVGSLMTNLSAFSEDGLVMRYGYVMEETTVTITDTMWDVQYYGHPKRNLSHSYGSTVKVRRRATPFGFGLNLGSLSDRQWAIIGALGISRVPKGLHK